MAARSEAGCGGALGRVWGALGREMGRVGREGFRVLLRERAQDSGGDGAGTGRSGVRDGAHNLLEVTRDGWGARE